MTKLEEFLKHIYLFSAFEPGELEKIAASAHPVEVPMGHSLYSEGSEATSMYVVMSGSLKVTTNSQTGDDVKLTTIGAGEHFGELPFLDGERRSANIEAVETSMVLEITYADLRTVLAQSPSMELKFFKELGFYLVRRFRALTNDITKAREIRKRYS